MFMRSLGPLLLDAVLVYLGLQKCVEVQASYLRIAALLRCYDPLQLKQETWNMTAQAPSNKEPQ